MKGKKNSGRGAYKEPDREAKPRIRGPLRKIGKGVASRFFQLLSGHAMIAPFLKEKWGWTDSDKCWWCDGRRQSRDHLFKECSMWKKEIAELWKEIGRISGKRRKKETTGTTALTRAGRVLAFRSDRQGQDPATPPSGSCSLTADTRTRFWTF